MVCGLQGWAAWPPSRDLVHTCRNMKCDWLWLPSDWLTVQNRQNINYLITCPLLYLKSNKSKVLKTPQVPFPISFYVDFWWKGFKFIQNKTSLFSLSPLTRMITNQHLQQMCKLKYKSCSKKTSTSFFLHFNILSDMNNWLICKLFVSCLLEAKANE